MEALITPNKENNMNTKTIKVPYTHEIAHREQVGRWSDHPHTFDLVIDDEKAVAYIDPNTEFLDRDFYRLTPTTAVHLFHDHTFEDLDSDENNDRHDVPVSIGKHLWVEHAAEYVASEMTQLVNASMNGDEYDGYVLSQVSKQRVREGLIQVILRGWYSSTIDKHVAHLRLRDFRVEWTTPYRFPTEDIVEYWKLLQYEEDFGDLADDEDDDFGI